jgi:2,3-bisphosphoglycerate-independent phosphoglycerate mutase
MTKLELIKGISHPSPTKIILCVFDGLGGLPHPETGKTELETANIPNLDRLAASGICGLADIVGHGITPGSGPGHLALFGYDPISCNIGRGVLEAVGIDFGLERGDVAARGNFCTIDPNGTVTDRRAGRISSEQGAKLCQLLDGMEIEQVRLIVRPVKEHRLVVVFRGQGLDPDLSDSDPQQIGATPKDVTSQRPAAAKTADVANQFLAQARKILAKHHPANMVLLRGFSQKPNLPTFEEVYQLTPAAIAIYPMYRGLARLAGMKVLETGSTIIEEIDTLKQNYANHDYFFVHVKGTDSAGEDGDFDRKVHTIEEFDRLLPGITSLEPDVVIVTGDHSTPATFKGHSWHPVPLLLSARWCRPDRVSEFSESACISGGLGRFPAVEIMPLAMAHALKLNKFGA